MRLQLIGFLDGAVLRAHAASAATITVSSGRDLQAAVNVAKPGDTILLQAGATFAGNFTLPAKNGTSHITLRSSAPDSSLPPGGAHSRRSRRTRAMDADGSGGSVANFNWFKLR